MVGYKDPPKEYQFGPDNPGNRKGRKPGSRNKPKPVTENAFVSRMLENANRLVRGKENGEDISLPRIDVVIESLFQEAAKRNTTAQKAYLQMYQLAETLRAEEQGSALETALDYIRDWEEELARRESLGIDLPDPVPHPEDIITDPETGEVRIHGPRTREEKELHDRFYEQWDAVYGALFEIEDRLKETTDPDERKELRAEQKELGIRAARLQEIFPKYSSRHRQNRARRKP